MSAQYVSNEDAFAVVCRTYYRLKRKHRKKLPKLSRIGALAFDLRARQVRDISDDARHVEERLALKEVGGGFIRGSRPMPQRSPHDGKVI